MALEETKALFDKIAHTLQENIPEGEEAKFTASGAGDQDREKLFGLIPEPLRTQAFSEAMALSDNDAYACVNRTAVRAGLRPAMSMVTIAYFSNPFWKDLFIKAAQSETARAKKGG
jgi:hypothetical protein